MRGIIVIDELHIADAAGEGNIALNDACQTGYGAILRHDLSFDAQVLDDGAVAQNPERIALVISVHSPVDRERMSLSVERAGIMRVSAAYYPDILAEVDIGRHLGVEDLSAFHEVAVRLPVALDGDFKAVVDDEGHCYGAVFIDGGGGREAFGEDEPVGVGGAVFRAQDFLRGGQAGDMAAVVGVARGLHLAIVGERYFVHPLLYLVGELRNSVGAEHLSPEGIFSALLQQPCHLAALELLLGYRRALRLAAGVEVVAVLEVGVLAKGVAKFVGGVVRAEVDAVVQGAGTKLLVYKSGHSLLAALRCGVECSLDDAVGELNSGIAAYMVNHARHSAWTIFIVADENHIADATGDGVCAKRGKNQSGQKAAARRDPPFGVQVADGGAIHIQNGGYPIG